MTFEVTVLKIGGEPIPMALVLANDETSGTTFSRGTDGNGYCHIDMKATPTDGRPITLSVTAGGYQNAIVYPTMTPANQTLQVVLASFKRPFQAAPRFWNGVNMCGVRIPGLPAVSGGAADPSLFLSWFYHKYDHTIRAQIRATMHARSKTHWLLSWPDVRADGWSVGQFTDLCRELVGDGFLPCVMLTSKAFDSPNAAALSTQLSPVVDRLVGLVPMFSIGWELNLWWSPEELQRFIDLMSPRLLQQDGTLVYVHFGPHVIGWQPNGKSIADFWKANIGKLTGCLGQAELGLTDAALLDWLHDCLTRFAGNFFMPTDSGFGHPFDFVMLEVTANDQFNGKVSEQDGDRKALVALNAPHEHGPAGEVGVMGIAN